MNDRNRLAFCQCLIWSGGPKYLLWRDSTPTMKGLPLPLPLPTLLLPSKDYRCPPELRNHFQAPPFPPPPPQTSFDHLTWSENRADEWALTAHHLPIVEWKPTWWGNSISNLMRKCNQYQTLYEEMQYQTHHLFLFAPIFFPRLLLSLVSDTPMSLIDDGHSRYEMT